MRTREAILPDAERIHELISAYSVDGTLLPARMCATSWSWNIAGASSDAALCTSMASTLRKYVQLRLIPPNKALEAASAW